MYDGADCGGEGVYKGMVKDRVKGEYEGRDKGGDEGGRYDDRMGIIMIKTVLIFFLIS